MKVRHKHEDPMSSESLVKSSGKYNQRSGLKNGPQVDSFLGETIPADISGSWGPGVGGTHHLTLLPGKLQPPPPKSLCRSSYLQQMCGITSLALEKQGNFTLWRMRIQAGLSDGRTVTSLLPKVCWCPENDPSCHSLPASLYQLEKISKQVNPTTTLSNNYMEVIWH